MGYSISDELKTKYLAREPQICNIRVDFLSGTTQPGSRTYIILTDEDIVSQGLNIDRALFTGNTLELGTAISAESTITLNNSDGRFDKFHFEGARLQIYVGLKSDGRNISAGTAGGRVKSVSDDGNTVTVDTIRNIVNAVPMGTFWVDNCPRRTKRITLQCLDSFAKMDLTIPLSSHGISTNSIALYEMISQICSKIGLTLYATTGDSFSSYLSSLFPNTYNKSVVLPQIDDKLTYRALFQHCIQMLGGYAFMDWDNNVHVAKYGSSAISPTITAAQRYTSDVQENSISVTGVSVTYKDSEDSEQRSLYGTTDYAVSISGNPLITPDNVSDIAQSIKSQTFGSWYYYPFTAKCKPMVWVYPLDKVAIENQSGTSVTSYVTNTNFTLNGTMVIESKGETKYEKGWASSNAFTAKQTSIIESASRQNATELRQRYQDLLNLNEALARSMGLWHKKINNVDYYYSVVSDTTSTEPPSIVNIDLTYGNVHATHQGKDVIYMFGTGGFGICTSFDSTVQTESGRNNLNTEAKILNKLVWNYGITKDGNAVLNRITAYKITADEIQTGLLSSINNDAYFNLNTGEICAYNLSDKYTLTKHRGLAMYYDSTSSGTFNDSNLIGNFGVGTNSTSDNKPFIAIHSNASASTSGQVALELISDKTYSNGDVSAYEVVTRFGNHKNDIAIGTNISNNTTTKYALMHRWSGSYTENGTTYSGIQTYFKLGSAMFGDSPAITIDAGYYNSSFARIKFAKDRNFSNKAKFAVACVGSDGTSFGELGINFVTSDTLSERYFETWSSGYIHGKIYCDDVYMNLNGLQQSLHDILVLAGVIGE